MSDQYEPIVGFNDGYPLANTSTANMEALDKLKLRAPCVGDAQRQQIAKNYGYDPEENPSAVQEAIEEQCEDDTLLSPPRFWEEAAKVVFMHLGESDLEEGQLDFAEARRGVADFTQAGNERAMELMQSLGA